MFTFSLDRNSVYLMGTDQCNNFPKLGFLGRGCFKLKSLGRND